MINRYPHTATIKITTEIVSDSGIPTTSTESIEVKGRYEPSVGNGGADANMNYKAVFFCQTKLAILETDKHALDGQTMVLNGRSISIVQGWNFQTHCELWLD